MKHMLMFGFMMLLLAATSCKKDDSPTNGSGGLGGNGGTGGVTWTIGQHAGGTGVVFTGTPSVAATVTQVILSLPANNFRDTVIANGTTVYPASQAQDINEYTGVASGQQWTFVFTGKLGSATGTQYTVTSNYTVP